MELHIPLDRTSGANLPHQIGRAIIELICDGVLKAGTRLPASRELAQHIGVARLTIVEAYQWLAEQGYVAARRGSRTVVQDVGPHSGKVETQSQGLDIQEPKSDSPPISIDFRPGRPNLHEFPRRRWGNTLAAALQDVPVEYLDYGDPLGYMPLREALSSYLRRSRGLSAHPRQIAITAGSGQALDIVLRALPDHREVVVEQPGHSIVLRLLALHGVKIVETPVDLEGIRTDPLPTDTRSRVALVTPSHQFPMGVRMSLARRRDLISWASRTKALIVEDDYDSEFAYDGRPLIPLASLDRSDRVVYMGTFSKTLAPGLRLGFMILPIRLVDAVAKIKLWSDYGGNVVQQAALARWIDDGSFERHLYRMRTRYRLRQMCLVEEVDRLFGERARIIGAPVGMHATIGIEADRSAAEIAERAAGRGVGLYPLIGAAGMLRKRERAFVMGFGNLSEKEIKQGLAALAEAAA